MSVERAELPGEESERDWRDRLGEILSIARGLLATRLAIFREEATGKIVLAARGLVAVAVALALIVGALLLAAALLAAVLAKLTNSVVLGILLAVVLYGAGAAAAGWMAFKSLSQRPPVRVSVLDGRARAGLEGDRCGARAASRAGRRGRRGARFLAGGRREDIVDLEERLRRGTE